MRTASGRSRLHRVVLISATVLTGVLVTSGGVVCVTESARGCPDWPRCYGQMLPPMRLDAIIEYTHRLTAALTSPFLVMAAVLGWMKARADRWVSWPTLAAVPLAAAVATFGAIAVLEGLPPWAAAIDLGSALMTLALLLTASLVAGSREDGLPGSLSFSDRSARLALWAAASLFVVLVSGVLVAERGSLVRCLGCIVDPKLQAGPALRSWPQMAREVAAAVASALIVAVVARSWLGGRARTSIRRIATAAGVLLVAEVCVGALLIASGPRASLLVIGVAIAVALWAALVALVVLNGLAAGTTGARPVAPAGT